MFRTVPLSIIRSNLRAGAYAPARKLSANLYDMYHCCVCTVKNSWWWTEERSEICRVSFRKYIWKNSASNWFYFKKFITVHGHVNVKCNNFRALVHVVKLSKNDKINTKRGLRIKLVPHFPSKRLLQNFSRSGLYSLDYACVNTEPNSEIHFSFHVQWSIFQFGVTKSSSYATDWMTGASRLDCFRRKIGFSSPKRASHSLIPSKSFI